MATSVRTAVLGLMVLTVCIQEANSARPGPSDHGATIPVSARDRVYASDQVCNDSRNHLMVQSDLLTARQSLNILSPPRVQSTICRADAAFVVLLQLICACPLRTIAAVLDGSSDLLSANYHIMLRRSRSPLCQSLDVAFAYDR